MEKLYTVAKTRPRADYDSDHELLIGKFRLKLDLTEGEDIKKRGQEYTEELYKKDLHDPENHNGVITHLESDILECEVR